MNLKLERGTRCRHRWPSLSTMFSANGERLSNFFDRHVGFKTSTSDAAAKPTNLKH
jgi:hypothetical protein